MGAQRRGEASIHHGHRRVRLVTWQSLGHCSLSGGSQGWSPDAAETISGGLCLPDPGLPQSPPLWGLPRAEQGREGSYCLRCQPGAGLRCSFQALPPPVTTSTIQTGKLRLREVRCPASATQCSVLSGQCGADHLPWTVGTAAPTSAAGTAQAVVDFRVSNMPRWGSTSPG